MLGNPTPDVLLTRLKNPEPDTTGPRGQSIAGRPRCAVASQFWGLVARWRGGFGVVVLTMLESEVSVGSLESACDCEDVIFSHSDFALS